MPAFQSSPAFGDDTARRDHMHVVPRVHGPGRSCGTVQGLGHDYARWRVVPLPLRRILRETLGGKFQPCLLVECAFSCARLWSDTPPPRRGIERCRAAHRITACSRIPWPGSRRFGDERTRPSGEVLAILSLTCEGRFSPRRRGACALVEAHRPHAV
jgi:hypothetical protein